MLCDSEACKHVIKAMQCQYTALSLYCSPTCYCISFFWLPRSFSVASLSPPSSRVLGLFPKHILVSRAGGAAQKQQSTASHDSRCPPALRSHSCRHCHERLYLSSPRTGLVCPQNVELRPFLAGPLKQRMVQNASRPLHKSLPTTCLGRRLSVASFVVQFSQARLWLERKLRAGSVGFFTYFHLVYSPEFFSNGSCSKSTLKVLREAIEVMVTIDHELVANSPSPPFAFLSGCFQMSIPLPLEKRLTGVIWVMEGCQKPNFFSCRNTNFVYL